MDTLTRESNLLFSFCFSSQSLSHVKEKNLFCLEQILLSMTNLQIKGGIEDNSKIFFFLFLNENICCDPSLEPS